MAFFKTVIAAAALLLLSCGSAFAAPGLRAALAETGNENAKPSAFILCHGHGCRLRTKIRLSEKEWGRVRSAFSPAAANAQGERKQISRAIGLLEKITGPRAGTSGDVGGTFSGAFSDGQMDCEDESLNTGVYLVMMQDRKLLRFHSVAGLAHRGAFLNGWPHRAIKIEETRTHHLYVVDSWFHNNGQPAEIIEADKWQDGWKPAAK